MGYIYVYHIGGKIPIAMAIHELLGLPGILFAVLTTGIVVSVNADNGENKALNVG